MPHCCLISILGRHPRLRFLPYDLDEISDRQVHINQVQAPEWEHLISGHNVSSDIGHALARWIAVQSHF